MAELSISAQNGKTTIKEFQKMFEPVMDAYFDSQKKYVGVNFDTEYSNKAIEVFHDISTRQAKRLRASFVYYVYKMFGGEKLEEALKTGVIIELLHAYLLIIDDFMDDSDTRRGGPTAHKIFEQYYEDKGFTKSNKRHFGASIAVNTGIIGTHMAMRGILDLDFDSKILKRVAENLNERLVITGHGQITDVINAVANEVDEEYVLKTLKWKTGVYTYENPMHVGAILAEADEKDLKILSEYAIPGGISFQIQDDILGMFGDSKVTGKSAMDDLREGKYTLLIHKALEAATTKQKEIINNALGNPNLTTEMHENVKEIITDTGSLEYSKNKAKELVAKAKNALIDNRQPKWQDEGFNYLINIADYVIEREK